MTKDTLAISSHWEKGYGPQKETKEMTHRFVLNLSPLSDCDRERKNLNRMAMIIYKRSTTIGRELIKTTIILHQARHKSK